jgi:hypothetical protein
MQEEGFLLGIAQIGVTLAGFSGLVVAIRGAPPNAWHPRDIWSLSWMFGTSLGAVFIGLLPLLLARLHLATSMVWRASGLVMCTFTLAFTIAMALSGRRLSKSGHRPRVRYFPPVAMFLLLICSCLCGLTAAGLFPEFNIGFFALSLLSCLLVSALSLVVFLVVLARAAIRTP